MIPPSKQASLNLWRSCINTPSPKAQQPQSIPILLRECTCLWMITASEGDVTPKCPRSEKAPIGFSWRKGLEWKGSGKERRYVLLNQIHQTFLQSVQRRHKIPIFLYKWDRTKTSVSSEPNFADHLFDVVFRRLWCNCRVFVRVPRMPRE